MNKNFKVSLVVLLTIVSLSCEHKVEPNKNLVSFTQEHLRDLTEKEFDNYTSGKTEIKEKIVKKQQGDTLYATVDFPWDGCADMEGDLKYNKDSLTLIYGLKEETLCTEVIYYRLKYKILNKERADYALGFQYRK